MEANTTTKLTPDVLFKIGFYGEGKGITNRPLYRLKWQENSYLFQIELGDYPDTNPNSGVLSLYFPELKDQHCLSHDKKENKGKTKRLDYIQGEDEKYIWGIKYVNLPAQQMNVAWHVTTLERLNAIYTALTLKEPLSL